MISASNVIVHANAGRVPTDVAVSPDGTKIYVSNADGTVLVLSAV